MNKDLLDIVKKLPQVSGVYLMKNKNGKVIYVGKAIDIRKRVRSYFNKKTESDHKTNRLVENISKIDYIETDSEAEALILEASLIKQFHPKYNIDLKDDKSYPLIEITAEEFPKISLQRPKKKKLGAKYYGPYVNAGLVREALVIIRKIFHFRTCNNLPNKECLDFHIGLCDAPCIKKISKSEYYDIVKNVCLILEGKKGQLYKRLQNKMAVFSKNRKYEKAAKTRDQIRSIGALYSGTKDINYFKEADQLKRVLSLETRPERIEAFDISNTMGQQAVGSMVSFLNGKSDKRNYRRFRIKDVDGIDDFKMTAEVVRRRYSRLRKEGSSFPDLILIDGGKGQLSAANMQIIALGINIPIISLAKREEEIFLPNKKNPIILSKNSLGLKLLQRIRDEAHRFAITYHKNLRSKNLGITK